MKTLDALLPANAGERRTLADIIFSKIEDMESGKTTVIRKTTQGIYAMFMVDPLRLTRSYPQIQIKHQTLLRA